MVVGLQISLGLLLLNLSLVVSLLKLLSSFVILHSLLCEVVGELLLLHIGDSIDVLELPLPVPVLVEEVVVRPQFLSHFSYQVQVLLRHESADVNVRVLLVQHLDPDQSLSSHHGFHEPEVETPDHDDAENDSQGGHHDPVLDVVDAKHAIVETVLDAILVPVSALLLSQLLVSVVVLFEVGVEQQSALGKGDEQDEEADVSANHSEKLRAAQLLRLDVEVVVSAAVLAVDLLRSHNLGRDAVGVDLLVLAVAGFDELGVDSKELQVLPFVLEVLLQALEQGRQKAVWQSLDHVVSVDHEDGSRSLAQVADLLLLVDFKHILVQVLCFTHHWSLPDFGSDVRILVHLWNHTCLLKPIVGIGLPGFPSLAPPSLLIRNHVELLRSNRVGCCSIGYKPLGLQTANRRGRTNTSNP